MKTVYQLEEFIELAKSVLLRIVSHMISSSVSLLKKKQLPPVFHFVCLKKKEANSEDSIIAYHFTHSTGVGVHSQTPG